MGRSGRNRRSTKEKPENPGKLNEWPDGWGDGLDDPSQYSSAGRNRRSMKKKPAKVNEWADGWGDGLDDPSQYSSSCILRAIYPSSDKRG